MLRSLRRYRDALGASVRQHGVTSETSHRPWPAPDRPWFMAQTGERLLFAHWALPPEVLRPLVHPALPLDTFEGRAWIAVTPFEVVGFRLRYSAPLLGMANFPETNVRTYVTIDGKPGIYFFSLDAANPLAVVAARRLYRLPYFRARMKVGGEGDHVDYSTERTSRDGPPAALRARYGPVGDCFHAERESLEYWLTERYCLYTLDDEQHVHRADIHHPPWPLHPAEAELETNTMARPLGIGLEGEPLLHYAPRQDVVFWLRQRV